MVKFVFSINYLSFLKKLFQQITGRAPATKFAPPYAFIYVDELSTEFFQTQRFKPLVWLKFIDDIYFYMDAR